MKCGRRKLVVASVLLLLVGYFAMNTVQGETNFFSTKLKEGTVLEWETVVEIISPDSKIVSGITRITVLEDIPDLPIDYDFMYRYFNFTFNEEVYPDYIIGYLVTDLIYPILYVEGNTTVPLYEAWLKTKQSYPEVQIERKSGDITINGTFDYGEYGNLTLDMTIHEKTGVVRHKYEHLLLYDHELISEYTYLGGMNLVDSDFNIVLIALCCLSLTSIVSLKIRRKSILP